LTSQGCRLFRGYSVISIKNKFEYDKENIHKIYDKARELPSETYIQWFKEIEDVIQIKEIKYILDFGCGTGRFSNRLDEYFNSRVTGIDPSEKMICVAKKNNMNQAKVQFIHGNYMDIPKDNKFSIIFLSMVYHYIKYEIQQIINIFKSIIINHGIIVIRKAIKENIKELFLFNFFPKAKAIDYERVPANKEIIEIFKKNKFAVIKNKQVNQLFAITLDEFIRKISMRGLSGLKMISDNDFEKGLKLLKEYKIKNSDHRIYEGIQLLIFQKSV